MGSQVRFGMEVERVQECFDVGCSTQGGYDVFFEKSLLWKCLDELDAVRYVETCLGGLEVTEGGSLCSDERAGVNWVGIAGGTGGTDWGSEQTFFL